MGSISQAGDDVPKAEISSTVVAVAACASRDGFALGPFVLRMFHLLSSPSCFVICKCQKPDQRCRADVWSLFGSLEFDGSPVCQ